MGDKGGKSEASSPGASGTKPEEEDNEDDFPPPTDEDFEDCVDPKERQYCIENFSELKKLRGQRLHCTACDKHLGLLSRHVNRYRMHPMLRTLVCAACRDFYMSGEFERGEDDSELYCRWCGQGGQVYCCAACPIVFCEKCIMRNLGRSKIKEIENNDDWKCFSCNPECLWKQRALYKVLILYCKYKSDKVEKCAEGPERLALIRKSQVDDSECCRHKSSKGSSRKIKNSNPAPTDKGTTTENKAIKRIGSPITIKKLGVSPQDFLVSPPSGLQIQAPPPKKLRAPTQVPLIRGPPPLHLTPIGNLPPPLRHLAPRPRLIRKPVSTVYNGYMGTPYMPQAVSSFSDTLNLSLENLTQGLDMSALGSSAPDDDNVVCTPDFPLPMEPECELHEEDSGDGKGDDDVQCLTPSPRIIPKPISALTNPRTTNPFSNIIQMTENDVTVNEVTGGLKFKVDPSTLSSSKMYKLPDGRVFAVNVNPKGGYSATIVSINEASLRAGNVRNPVPRLTQRTSQVNKNNKNHSWTTPVSNPAPKKKVLTQPYYQEATPSRITRKTANSSASSTGDKMESVEWYRYNIVDAIDVMNYVLTRLTKLKQEHDNTDLKSKSPKEIKAIHQNFEQLLKTSSKRFGEVKDHLNSGFKEWLEEKNCTELYSDDDEVQILSTSKDDKDKAISNDEPIFIDENSNDSTSNQDKQDADNEQGDFDPLANVTCNLDGEKTDEKDDNEKTEEKDENGKTEEKDDHEKTEEKDGIEKTDEKKEEEKQEGQESEVDTSDEKKDKEGEEEKADQVCDSSAQVEKVDNSEKDDDDADLNDLVEELPSCDNSNDGDKQADTNQAGSADKNPLAEEDNDVVENTAEEDNEEKLLGDEKSNENDAEEPMEVEQNGEGLNGKSNEEQEDTDKMDAEKEEELLNGKSSPDRVAEEGNKLGYSTFDDFGENSKDDEDMITGLMD